MKITRPAWTELIRLQQKSDFDAAAARLFGDRPAPKGTTTQPYGSKQYRERLGIEIERYEGFFAEVGQVDAPTGPVTPATDRLPIRPILAIRQSRRGNYYVQGLKFTDGLFNRDKTRAWIKTEQYDALLGDDYFDQVEQKIQGMIETTNEDKPLHVVGLGDLDQRERAIFDKLHAGVDFAELSADERDIISAAMKRQTVPPQEIDDDNQ